LASELEAFTLFATHYFELTQLSEHCPQVLNVHLDAHEQEEHIVFLHKVKPGPASRSYGLQVARLAGIPSQVIQRAQDKLAELEQHNLTASPNTLAFDQPPPSQPVVQPGLFTDPAETQVLDQLAQLQPDSLSPKQALETLYQLQALLTTRKIA
jgi:DNA mismatch repair protein MutS